MGLYEHMGRVKSQTSLALVGYHVSFAMSCLLCEDIPDIGVNEKPYSNNGPSARTQTVFFCCSLEGGILEETSGRRHLGGIWEASGLASGELSGSWGGQGGLKGILDGKCSKFIMLYNKNEK